MSDNNKIPGGEQSARRDGTMDFSRYATEQLLEVRDTLDRNAFPLNFAGLMEELERRRSAAPLQWQGRLTRRNGLLGWLEGQWRRQPLYGESSLTLTDNAMVLTGRQRTWLGMPIARSLQWPLDQIRNVVASQATVRFEIRRRAWFSRQVELQMDSAAEADTLAAALPRIRTARFERLGLPLLTFEEELRKRCPHPWATPALVLTSMIVFLATWVTTGNLLQIGESPVSFWLANVGPLTLGGQWWRLFTALFTHANIAHLAFNMWALWHIGRLTERLLGTWTFLGLYLGSGLVASLSSLIWDPTRASVGASGAIFGLFGAFLALLIHRTSIPRGVFLAHWIPTLLFVVYNIVTGAFAIGIDNAAHAGGLIGGFSLGLALASTGGSRAVSSGHWRRVAPALILIIAFATGALLYLRSAKGPVPAPQQFAASHQWYISGESRNLTIWNRAASMSSAGAISDEVLGTQFERDILPFWSEALVRLEAELPLLSGEQQTYASVVTDFARVRRDWAQAIVRAAKDQDEEQGKLARSKMAEIDVVLARLHRLAARSAADQPATGLTNLPAMRKLRRKWSGHSDECVEETIGHHMEGGRNAFFDGPARRRALACEAQRNFVNEDFYVLDTKLGIKSIEQADLPDGSSSFSGYIAGLENLFEYGPDTVEDHLRRLAAWQRAIPDSQFPALLEAMLFNSWAWTARGSGFVQQVSQQSWALFAFRNEMAWAALEDAKPDAKESALGCRLTLNLLHDRQTGADMMRSTFDACIRRHPRDFSLYRTMLRSMLPRWGGSSEKISAFIDESVSNWNLPIAEELYTRLYWIYADLEQDQVNIFTNSRADWSRMHQGFTNMRKYYSESDSILNGFAYFACIAEDRAAYKWLRPSIARQMAASVWTRKINLAECDKKLR